MASDWVKHVQSVYQKGKAKGMSYKQAMQAAKKTWKSKAKGAAKKGSSATKKRRRKKAAAEEDAEAEDVDAEAAATKKGKKKAF